MTAPRPATVPDDPLALAAAYLTRVRRGESTSGVAAALRDLDSTALADALPDDASRLAFWSNVYNAATQDLLAAAPEQYEARTRFFEAPIVAVAGHDLSLNDVEHGVLRRSQLPWGLGYLRDPFPDAFERAHRVDRLDPRVHFALNCGAESCPPILAYAPTTSTRNSTSPRADTSNRRSSTTLPPAPYGSPECCSGTGVTSADGPGSSQCSAGTTASRRGPRPGSGIGDGTGGLAGRLPGGRA